MTLYRERDRAGRFGSETGAVLIQVAIACLVLVGLSSFVLDYGVMWTGRGQAQNAADAGALAGAVARVFDETGAPAPAGPAYNAALLAAQANLVMGQAGGVEVSWDCPAWVTSGRCARVRVHRDGTVGSAALPTYFAALFGQTSQRVKATATAVALAANATKCLRPWAVPDIWDEERTAAGTADPGRWSGASTFDRYVNGGKSAGTLLPTPPPLDDYTQLGYVNSMVGQSVTLKLGNQSDPITGGWFLAVDVPRADGTPSGGAQYKANIQSCNGLPVTINEYLNTETGAKQGPTVQGVGDLIATDPNAKWDDTTNTVINSDFASSPRIVVVALYDPKEFALRAATNNTSPCSSGGQCVKVANLFGFFVERIDASNNVIGRVAQQEGDFVEGGGTISDSAAFLWTFLLVQ